MLSYFWAENGMVWTSLSSTLGSLLNNKTHTLTRHLSHIYMLMVRVSLHLKSRTASSGSSEQTGSSECGLYKNLFLRKASPLSTGQQ
ncbi:hypothetical protein CGMCC3_g17263 [Colletotrichum fructicola]|nr:uncharacterized protein CGMCC3_g17263 [Colletotrichum fructicola]KAE9566592.1 hypothetical protein CGMCC3_g17263 [Colletotrichum fructicola]